MRDQSASSNIPAAFFQIAGIYSPHGPFPTSHNTGSGSRILDWAKGDLIHSCSYSWLTSHAAATVRSLGCTYEFVGILIA